MSEHAPFYIYTAFALAYIKEPPAVQGFTVHWIFLRRHISGVRAAITAGIAIVVVAAGTALATTGSHKPSVSSRPVAAVKLVSLQPSSMPPPPPPPPG